MALLRRGLTGLVPKLLNQAEAAICTSGLQGFSAPSWRNEDTSSSGNPWTPFRGAWVADWGLQISNAPARPLLVNLQASPAR